jgi:hypothetical protein
MSEPLELIRRLDALWIPGAVIAALVLLLILWEVALVLGVFLSVAGQEGSSEATRRGKR